MNTQLSRFGRASILTIAGLAIFSSLAVSTPALAVCGNGVVDAGEICVAPPVSIWAPGAPLVAVISADLNADGILDVAAATSNRSFVRLGTGAGFGAWSFWTQPGVGFRDLAVADFDGDGDLDLALADSIGNQVIVRWNNGGVNFSPGTAFAVGVQPVRVLAARLNADTRADFVTLNLASDTATVRLAVAGGFAAGVNYPVGNTDDIALGDCDASGRRDLLYYNGQGTGTLLLARPNNGAGGFGAPIVSTVPLFDPLVGAMEPQAIAAGDLNGDGAGDATIASSWSRLAPATSNGACLFTPHPYGFTWAFTFRIRAIDFDGNGNVDIAAPHGIGDRYSVAFGNGAGNFLPYDETQLPAPGVHDLAFGDYNGDGFGDVIVAGNTDLLYQRGTP